MRIGVTIKLDVTKIEKHRLFKGNKGTYLDCTTFIEINEQDQYGNNGFISQDVSKEEKENGVQGNILGNCKVFWTEQAQETQGQQQPQNQGNNQVDDPGEIPF